MDLNVWQRRQHTARRVQGTSSSGIQHRHRRQGTRHYRLQQPVAPTHGHLMKSPRPRVYQIQFYQ